MKTKTLTLVVLLALSGGVVAQSCAEKISDLSDKQVAMAGKIYQLNAQMNAQIESGQMSHATARSTLSRVCRASRDALALANSVVTRVGRDCWQASILLTPGLERSRIENIATFNQLVGMTCH